MSKNKTAKTPTELGARHWEDTIKKALLAALYFPLGSKVTVTKQSPDSPIFLKRQPSAISHRKMTVGQALFSLPQPLQPSGQASLIPLPIPVSLHPQTQQESKLLLAAKENISESHKRFLFFYYFFSLRLSSGCLSVTGRQAKRSWVGW